jgi:hypothetical protein
MNHGTPFPSDSISELENGNWQMAVVVQALRFLVTSFMKKVPLVVGFKFGFGIESNNTFIKDKTDKILCLSADMGYFLLLIKEKNGDSSSFL